MPSTTITFCELIKKCGIDERGVLLMRHTPPSTLAKVFPWLAVERPDVYNAYQQTQKPRERKQLREASFLASFIGNAMGEALFVGLYEQAGEETLSPRKVMQFPAHAELVKFRGHPYTTNVVVFDLKLTKHLIEYSGRLVVEWSGGTSGGRSWSRRATSGASKGYPIVAIHSESALSSLKTMPEWCDLVLTWDELQTVPAKWKTILSQWRGIYYIFDTSDRRGYVGSAYGKDNILGRWRNYAKRGHGGNKKLLSRDPSNFQFSILQRLDPDLPPNEVIEIEAKWKNRMHTRQFGLNEN